MTTDTRHATDLAHTWLRMWNEDPSLAHALVADPFAVWFGVGPVGDSTTDAGTLEDFVRRYRERTPNRFTPRVVVGDADTNRFAYTWDVELSEGRGTVTGIDVYTLDDAGRIAVNWSVTGTRQLPHDLPEPGGSARSRTALAAAALAWLDAGDGSSHPGAGFRAAGDLVVDEVAQRVAFTYEVDGADGDARGGIALLAFGPGGVDRAWTVTGTWPLRFV